MPTPRFRTRAEVRTAYPLAQLFDDLVVYITNSTLEKAASRTVTKTQLKGFVVAAKAYALGTPNGKLDRYDVFSVLFHEIDKCTNGKPTTGVASVLHTWSLDKNTILYMFDSRYGGK